MYFNSRIDYKVKFFSKGLDHGSFSLFYEVYATTSGKVYA